MVEVSSETADALEALAEDNDVDFETVRDTFKEKYENVKEKASAGVGEDQLERLALRSTRTAQLADNGVSTEGVEMLTIGGSIRQWTDTDHEDYNENAENNPKKDVFIGKAFVDLDPDSDKGRNFLSTVIIDSTDGVSLSAAQDAFSEVGNIVSGEFSVGEAHTDEFRVLNSSEDTEIDYTEPSDRSPMVEEIRDAVPETTIDSITDNMSQTERNDDGNVYPASFGVDIRRMTVDIYDGYKKPADGLGIYTVRDDTVFDDDDIVESVVFDEENANENATPGLTCFTDPSHMDYGTGAIVEMFGTISKNSDGVPTMNVDGIIPIVEEGGFDGYEDNSSSDTPEREETSSNVDRTSI